MKKIYVLLIIVAMTSATAKAQSDDSKSESVPLTNCLNYP